VLEFLLNLDAGIVIPSALLFAAVLLMVTGAYGFFAVRGVFSRRIGATAGSEDLSVDVGSSGIFLRDNTLKRFEKFVAPKSEEETLAIRKRLARAGYRDPQAVRIFYVSRALCGLGGVIVAAFLLPLLVPTMPIQLVILITCFITFVGFIIPSYWVERQIQTRREQARLGFPDVLDMLLVCIEGGHGIDQALLRVARESERSNAVLAQELGIVGSEMRHGRDRRRVLKNFADRLGVDDITAFVSVLVQSEEYGVSIADALRVYAADMRNKRIMRAEEIANKMPVKLALGTILFTVPPVMIILAGPSVVMILRAFALIAQGGGGRPN
jgi:tight adherence protein C